MFLCTHQLRYAQEICTRYGLMEEGGLLAMGTLEGTAAAGVSDDYPLDPSGPDSRGTLLSKTDRPDTAGNRFPSRSGY